MVSFVDIVSSLVELNKKSNVAQSSQQPDLEGSLVIVAPPYNTELENVFSSSTCLLCGHRELYSVRKYRALLQKQRNIFREPTDGIRANKGERWGAGVGYHFQEI